MDGIMFRCPKCGGDNYGTSGETGQCHGRERGGRPCSFVWSRRHDFRVFVRSRDGRGFESAREYDVACGLLRSSVGRAWTLAETLHELLAEIMIAPPTLAVVELWSLEEKRQALEWASREVLALEGEDLTRVERPIFVLEGAATA